MKLTVTYSRTLQLKQYEPLTVSATLENIECKDNVEKTVAEYALKLENAVDKQLLEKYNSEYAYKTDQASGIDFM